MEISTNRKAILKTMEKKAFEDTQLEIVAVKSAPWASADTKFGYVRPSGYRSGSFSVHLHDGGSVEYPTLDAMLDEWIGD
ncbi:hypothetical protein OIU34_22975 [Pararhizobium sp. BT-229]|uniref:hypothetical protein n=1 Tax=Pararhizobium sp. BT-229 TaxID=2986923 RepID=UPI0021F79D61|nr:hypothetical protein [Pararhizobium sp. BT-229]MCV9964758.1 hypothetical protein [Pararhizobium sp. BT-229]